MRADITLRLEDGEEKSFPFRANGCTPVFYRMMFRSDLFRDFGELMSVIGDDATLKAVESEDPNASTIDQIRLATKILGSGKMDTLYRLAFIMNANAEGLNMSLLSYDMYCDWLMQFDSLELLYNARTFMTLYGGTRMTASALKKKQGGRPRGK